jgi:hypothetical protein
MNNIPSKQNEQKQLERLAAQRELYSSAKRRQVFQVFINVIIAIPLSTVSIWFPLLAPISAFYGILISIVDSVFLESTIQKLKSKAAKIQELFDCDVLELSCSPLKTIDDVSVEEVLVHYDAHKKIPSNIERIRDWYPKNVGDLPLEIARLICQRSNCWWDSNLRRRLAFWTKLVAIVVSIVIVILAFINDVTFVTLVLILSGLLPFFQYCIRDHSEQKETAERLNALMNYINIQWDKALKRNVTKEQLTESSRRIQDEIFENRSHSPLILDFVYKVLRRKDEEIMNRAADVLVEEAKKYLIH